LLEKAFLLKLLYRYSAGQIRIRTSSPKIVPLCPALIHSFSSPEKIIHDAAWYGHVFEAAIISRFNELGYEMFYWTDSKNDVDLVIRNGDLLVALEIKSNDTLDWRGLNAFRKVYPMAKILAVNKKTGLEILSAEDIREYFKAMVML